MEILWRFPVAYYRFSVFSVVKDYFLQKLFLQNTNLSHGQEQVCVCVEAGEAQAQPAFLVVSMYEAT